MSIETFKSLENLTEFLYSEIKRASLDPNIDDKTFKLLKESVVDAINLKRKIESVRAWAITVN